MQLWIPKSQLAQPSLSSVSTTFRFLLEEIGTSLFPLTWDQAFFFFFLCFFASLLLWLEREKQKTDYRDKGRGHDRRLYFLQFFVFYSCIARDSYTSTILASFACLSTKMMSGLLALAILSHGTLKSHNTCSRVCLCHWSARSSSAFPHSCQCTYRATLSCRLLYSRRANLQHSLVRWLTLSLILRFCQCKTSYS